MEKTEKRDFKKWLEYLQQESWQLELIISSVLLVVLSSTDEIVDTLGLEIMANIGSGSVSFLMIIPIALSMVLGLATTNLIIHIFLRGFWIGCIGLRYVSGEIDIDSLNYSSKFSNYLKSQGLDFDRYLENLEKICSIIFSFTFLLIFSSLSFFAFLIFSGLILNLIDWFDNYYTRILGGIVLFVFMLSVLLSFLDYILLGYFKRQKFLSKIFYPFYRIFNFLSLAFIYRPLYYNFIDNPFGRKYLRMVVPYIFGLLIFSDGFSLGAYNFMPEFEEGNHWVFKNYYEDKWDNAEEMSGVNITIPSMEIKEDVFPLYLRYEDSKRIDNVLKEICPDFAIYNRSAIEFEAIKDFMRGVNSRAVKEEVVLRSEQLKADSSIHCLVQLFDLKIDTLVFENQKFHFYKHPELKSRGLITYIDISNFERGDHTLFVKKKINYRDSAFVYKTFEIPFVKYN